MMTKKEQREKIVTDIMLMIGMIDGGVIRDVDGRDIIDGRDLSNISGWSRYYVCGCI